MDTMLTQSAAAAFPDRGHTGLRIALAPGNEGAHLSHDLGATQPALHVRFALAPATAVGGRVRIAGGQGDTGGPVWWIDYDADLHRVTVELGDTASMTATLNALPWHVVELKLDTGAGEAALWINGVSNASLSGDFQSLAARHVWLGALFKDSSLSGELHLDEWAIATDVIGPVTRAPTRPYADDPTRWLVIYNSSVPDAITWALAYRQARGVPLANLLGLDLPSSETISEAQYAELVAAISDYLSHTQLDAQVMGVLVGYRVPGYVDFGDNGTVDAVPALLHRLVSHGGPVSNVNNADALPTRPTDDDLGDDRLTARIDGPNLAAALALIDRATTLIDAGLGDGSEAKLWYDPFAGDGALVESHVLRMIEWARSLDAQRPRLAMVLSAALDAVDEPASFEAIHHDGFLWTWDLELPPLPPEGFFAEPAGKRVACLQLHIIEPVATTVRNASAVNWIETALASGYAAAAATTRNYSGSAVPYARPFFEAMRRGWTISEAWYLALPMLREGLYLVGDPLLRTAFPQQGWNVHGPMDRLEALAPDAPSQMLRAEQRSLALSETLPEALEPTEGATAFYVVRHVDAKGRAEASATAVRVVKQAGEAARAALAPVWPDHPQWPVHVEDGALLLRLLWERSMSAAGVEDVELRGEVDGAGEQTLAEPALDPRRLGVAVTLAMPTVWGRYRWRVRSWDGVVYDTPWSRVVRPRAEADEALHLLEVRP